MNDIMEFSGREEFRQWLTEHCLSDVGVWLLFGKAGGPKTIKAGEALEEFFHAQGEKQMVGEK